MRDPGLAAILSFFIPGMGQLYNGKWGRALLWFIFTPGLWLGTGGMLGWVAHIVSAITAHNYAQRHPYRD